MKKLKLKKESAKFWAGELDFSKAKLIKQSVILTGHFYFILSFVVFRTFMFSENYWCSLWNTNQDNLSNLSYFPSGKAGLCQTYFPSKTSNKDRNRSFYKAAKQFTIWHHNNYCKYGIYFTRTSPKLKSRPTLFALISLILLDTTHLGHL